MGNFSAFPLGGPTTSPSLPELAHTGFLLPGSSPTAGLPPGTSSYFTEGLFVSPLLKLIMFSGQMPQAITTKGK